MGQLQAKTDAAHAVTITLIDALKRLIEAGELAAQSLNQENVVDGYLPAKTNCTWDTLCGLIKPPWISFRESQQILSVMREIHLYHSKAAISLASIQQTVDEAKQTLTGVIEALKRGDGIPWATETDIQRRDLKRWRNKSKKHLQVLYGIQEKYSNYAHTPQKLDRLATGFSFPQIRIHI